MFSSCIIFPAPLLAHSRNLVTICSMNMTVIEPIKFFVQIRVQCGKSMPNQGIKIFYRLQGDNEVF